MLQLIQKLALISILISGLRFDISAVNMNPERVIVILIALYTPILLVGRNSIRFTAASWPYLGWFIMIFISAALSGFLKHINGVLISASPFIFYFIFMQPTQDTRSLYRFIGLCLTVVSILSIVVFTIWVASGSLAPMIDRGRIKLLMPEPNILGATLVALLLLYSTGNSFGVRKVLVSCITLVAVALAGSKMPIFAYICGVSYIAIKSKIYISNKFFVCSIFSLLTIAAIGVIFSKQFLDIYAANFARQDSINNRMYGLDLAWQRFLDKPVLGNGPLDFSFADSYILSQMGTESEHNMWIWQIWMAVAHDVGIVGFICFFAFIIVSLMFCHRMIRQGYIEYVGAAAAIISLIVTSQATTTHLAGIFGMVFGIANSRLGRQQVPALTTERENRLSA